MAEMAADAVAFLNGESFGARIENIVVERKGIIRFQFDITGVAVHSANCFNGANAILEASHKIIELEKWKDEAGITCNCGVISGGTTANTVAESCTFFADIRYLTAEQLETVNKRVREIADTVYVEGCRTNLSVKSYRINMERCERNLALLENVNDAYEKCGIERLPAAAARGGSDAADMTAYGIPTLDSLGVCGGYIHSTKEYGFISSLTEVAKRFAAVAMYIED
jgi:glutamate carboxypeptidase